LEIDQGYFELYLDDDKKNLRICCIWLVESVESVMMHGLANPKFVNSSSKSAGIPLPGDLLTASQALLCSMESMKDETVSALFFPH
jgi:hypothetical protein